MAWTRTYGVATNSSEYGQSITVGKDGQIYITGASNRDLIVQKWTTSGAWQWTKTTDSGGTDYGMGIASGKDGKIYVAGRYSSSSEGILEVPRQGHSSGERLECRAVDLYQRNRCFTDGGIYVIGSSGRFSFLMRYSAAGLRSWTKTSTLHSFNGIAISPDASLYLTGETLSVFWNQDMLLQKYK